MEIVEVQEMVRFAVPLCALLRSASRGRRVGAPYSNAETPLDLDLDLEPRTEQQ